MAVEVYHIEARQSICAANPIACEGCCWNRNLTFPFLCMSVICSTVVIFRSAFEKNFEYVKLNSLTNCALGKKGVVGRQFISLI